MPHWESYADEVVAVLDDAGSERAAIMALLDGGPMALFFAATYPERTIALIMANSSAKWIATPDDPMGLPPDLASASIALVERIWGTEGLAAVQAPSRASDERFRRWYAKYTRASVGRGPSGPTSSRSWRPTRARSSPRCGSRPW